MTDDDLTREDRLIHRVLDGKAGVGDWAEFELAARRDTAAWHRLATAMRGELALRRAGAALEARLPALPLPAPPLAAAPRGRRAALLAGALGWAAALLFGVLWAGAPAAGNGGAPEDSSPLVALPAASPPLAPADPWAYYLETGVAGGRVVRELPPMLLEATPRPDGTAVDVLFVRSALERATLDEVHELREDDAGRLTARPVPIATLISDGSL